MPLYKEGQFVDNTTAIPQGHSSNGRTAVSKTDGCEFESYCPCHFWQIFQNLQKVYP